MEENDLHLFFTCNFAREAWYYHPWYIRIDNIIPHANSVTTLILHMLSMNHPNGNLENILTFMWCLWKSRNDNLFKEKWAPNSNLSNG
jgi:hypothetical protein